MRWQLVFLLLCGVALAVFFPSLHGEFIMDDWGYITKNPLVTQSSTPLHFWGSFSQPDYWPLSYTFYWLFFRFFGENPFPYHLINIVLHAVNATLVYVLARNFNLRWPLWPALLFLLHPLNVQAVSWIIQFKTLLSTALALGSTNVYISYLRSGQVGQWMRSFGLFLGALLAKTSVIFLPFVLYLVPRATGKLGKVSGRLALLPFFAAALLGGWATLRVNDLNFLERAAPVFHLQWGERGLLAAQNLLFYLKMFLFPYPLAFIYPLTAPAFGESRVWWIALGIGLLLLFLFRLRRPEMRTPFFAYLVLLAPCLGLVSVPGMKLSLVSDHWAYLPNAFLVIFVAALIYLVPVPWLRTLCYVLLVPIGWLAHNHAATFASEESFWLRAQTVNPASAVPPYNLGTVYEKKGQALEAVQAFTSAVRQDPAHARAWYNLGRRQAMQGEIENGKSSLQRAIQADPRLAIGYLGLARLHFARGEKEEARAVLRRGLEHNPGQSEIVEMLNSLR